MDNDDDSISVYELGIIKNALRGRVLDVEDFRTEGMLSEDEEDMNNKVDAFQAELINIQQKLEDLPADQGINL
ncbi:hypothetical protein ACTXIP_12670 [Psychrobacter alimentarius]|uniref:hypothetical protein n=1 Tax=Psychrobacter alimentarius TaxID=261164 RepID=UPI003FCEE8AB